MDQPVCPKCGHRSMTSFFRPHFACSHCGVELESNLRQVSFVEWVIGGPIFVLIVYVMNGLAFFKGWSYAALMSLLFIPACILHAVVISGHVRLKVREE